MAPTENYRSPDAIPRAKKTVFGISQDMKRKRELNNHHPYDHLHPHLAHHAWQQPKLLPDHDAHTHPHEEERGPHTNQPGPIKYATKITQTGRRESISREHKPMK